MDVSRSIALISCVKLKAQGPCAAADLYTSTWFLKARRLVERTELRWFILSAHYGLLAPPDRVEPYELTLNKMRQVDRKVWAERVVRDFVPRLEGAERVVFFAGMRYREHLVPRLASRGLTIEVSMEGLGIGKQLSWLTKHA